MENKRLKCRFNIKSFQQTISIVISAFACGLFLSDVLLAQQPFVMSGNLNGESMLSGTIKVFDTSSIPESDINTLINKSDFIELSSLVVDPYKPPARLLYKLNLIHNEDASGDFFFTYESFVPQSIKFYLKTADGIQYLGKAGYKYPFKEWSYPYRFAAVNFKLQPGQSEFYVEIEKSLVTPFIFRVWSGNNFRSSMIWGYGYLGVLVGTMLVMTLYNFILYLSNRSLTYLFYTCFTGAWFFGELMVKGIAFQLNPDIAFPVLGLRAMPFFNIMSRVAFAFFFIAYLDIKVRTKWLYLIGKWKAVVTLFAGLSIFFVDDSIVRMLNSLSMIADLPLTIWVYSWAIKERQRTDIVFLIALSPLLIASALISLAVFNTSIVLKGSMWFFPTGFVIVQILFSLGIGDKMHQLQLAAQDKIRSLNEQLNKHIEKVEAIVEEKTRDIRSILQHIKQGIFTVTATGDIHQDYSAYLETLLGATGLGNKKFQDVFLNRLEMSKDEKSQVDSALSSMLGESEINFSVNEDKLPKLAVIGKISPMYLEIDWIPIVYVNDEVEKILVSVRDVTSLNALKAESIAQQKELRYISEIIEVPKDKFCDFVHMCNKLIEENSRLIRLNNVRNLEILKILFINAHTMKGISRGLNLKDLTNSLHLMEQRYAGIQKDEVSWNVLEMQQDLKEVEEILEVFVRVNEDKLGRSMDGKFVEIPLDSLQKGLISVENLKESVNIESSDLQYLERFISLPLFKSLNQLFAEIFASLPRLARDLGKELPRVECDSTDLSLSKAGCELLNNVFTHILRNSMDHGIENAAERVKTGKSPEGHISLKLTEGEQYFEIVYHDDGRGLDLEKIFQMGLEKKLLPKDAKFSLKETADLIFNTGFSTAPEVTSISGRGVGMDAVRTYIVQSGGFIDISFRNPPKNPVRTPFEFHIKMPKIYFRKVEGGADIEKHPLFDGPPNPFRNQA